MPFDFSQDLREYSLAGSLDKGWKGVECEGGIAAMRRGLAFTRYSWIPGSGIQDLIPAE
jgi:hypothetical protein